MLPVPTRSRLRLEILAPLLLAIAACSSGGDPLPLSLQERVIFEGADAISESVLLDLIARDLERYASDPRLPALDDAAFRIEYRYRLEGYDRVEVTPRVVAEFMIFHIEEGPRVYLGQVDFIGATVFRVDELRQLVPGRFLGDLPPYSLRLAILIEEGVLSAYRDRGYLDVAVTREVSPEPDRNGRLYVRFTIIEGKPYTVSELRGVPSEPALLARTQDFLARPYTPSSDERLEATIVDHYREHGHPYTTARAKGIVDRETGTVAIDVEAHPGDSARTGRTVITGATWTRDSFIEGRSGLETDVEYRGSDLRRAEERLMAANIFKRVRVAPGALDEESGAVPIEIEVEERESGEASIRGGYGSFERVRVGVDLTGINIWGGAESIRVGGTVSKAGYRGEAELGVPYILGTELRLGLSGYFENRSYPSFVARARGGVVSLSYPVTESFNVTVGLRRANIVTTNVDPLVPPGDLLDFDYTAIFLSPTLDLRDNGLVPTRGIVLGAELACSPSRFLSDVQFWSATGRFSFFIPLPGGIVFASSTQGGIVSPLGGTIEIPISLRYFAGGTNTVRGYRFEGIGPLAGGQPTGGQVFLAAQSEFRIPLIGDLQGAIFYDLGGVWFDRTQVDLADIRGALGFGFRYVTPAGALSADVGWNRSRRPGEHSAEFHLSVGFPF
jgi:outer membrane protein assembly complex protein YaeT